MACRTCHLIVTLLGFLSLMAPLWGAGQDLAVTLGALDYGCLDGFWYAPKSSTKLVQGIKLHVPLDLSQPAAKDALLKLLGGLREGSFHHKVWLPDLRHPQFAKTVTVYPQRGEALVVAERIEACLGSCPAELFSSLDPQGECPHVGADGQLLFIVGFRYGVIRGLPGRHHVLFQRTSSGFLAAPDGRRAARPARSATEPPRLHVRLSELDRNSDVTLGSLQQLAVPRKKRRLTLHAAQVCDSRDSLADIRDPEWVALRDRAWDAGWRPFPDWEDTQELESDTESGSDTEPDETVPTSVASDDTSQAH